MLAAALRASDLQVYLHTTLSPYKKPMSTCVNTGLTRMLCGASSAPRTRAPCLPLEPAVGLLVGRADVAHGTADALAHFPCQLPARTRGPSALARSPRPLAALTRSARRRLWRRVQRTAAPARERSRQRPEPHGRCARPHQDGFRRQSEALQSHRPSRHNRRSCAPG